MQVQLLSENESNKNEYYMNVRTDNIEEFALKQMIDGIFLHKFLLIIEKRQKEFCEYIAFIT